MSSPDLDKIAQTIADSMRYGTTWHWFEDLAMEGVKFHTELHLNSFVSKAELAAVGSGEWLGGSLHEKVRREFGRELGFDDEIRKLHEDYRREIDHMGTELIYWKQLAEDRK